jgi:DHA1 family bicyclomycin/chloramphenicol resistance-like MFS transporter
VVAALGALMRGRRHRDAESLPADPRNLGGLVRLAGTARQLIGHRGFPRSPGRDGLLDGMPFAYAATSRPSCDERAAADHVTGVISRSTTPVGPWQACSWPARPGPDPQRDHRRAGRDRRRRRPAAGRAVVVGLPQWSPWWRSSALMSAQGLVGPNDGASASVQVPEHPRTGSLSWVSLWRMPGVVAPIAALRGRTHCRPYGAHHLCPGRRLFSRALFGLTTARISPDPRPTICSQLTT